MVSHALVFILPDLSMSFTVETDITRVGIGSVLSQQDHPIDFFSKTFCAKLMSTSTYVRELFSIIDAIRKW